MRFAHALWLLPPVLAAVGLLIMVLATGGAAWAVAIGWAGAIAVLALVEAAAKTKRIRVFVALVAVVVLPLLVWEGGFFVWPAAVTLLVAASLGPPPVTRRLV